MIFTGPLPYFNQILGALAHSLRTKALKDLPFFGNVLNRQAETWLALFVIPRPQTAGAGNHFPPMTPNAVEAYNQLAAGWKAGGLLCSNTEGTVLYEARD